MKVDKITSERLAVLRFPLIVGVVFIHAYGTNIALSHGVIGIESPLFFSSFVQDFISQGLARVAVPLFFLISGYFFFLGFTFTKKSFQAKIKSRIKTLVIPFLFWNIFVLFLFVLAQSLPVTQVYFSGENAPILSFDVYDYANAIVGLTDMPIAYQFWFIRDLIVMVLVSPLIYVFLKRIPNIFFIIIVLCWFFNYWPVYIPSVVSVAFFYIGAFFAYTNRSLFFLDRFGTKILFLYVIVLIVSVLTKDYEMSSFLHRIGIVFGIISVLYFSKIVLEKKRLKKVLMWAGSCSFFVFAVHEPLLTIFKKIIYRLVYPSSDFMVLFFYIIIPIFVILLSLLLYFVLKKITPSVLSMISGGR